MNNLINEGFLRLLNHNEAQENAYKIIDKGDKASAFDLDEAEDMYKDGIPGHENPNGNNKSLFYHLNKFMKNDNPDEDTLYKQDKEIPEAEIQKLNKYANYDAKDMGLRQRMNNKVGGWYKSVYGDEPQKQDATGRPIQPQPKFALPEESKTISSKDGVGISDSYKRLAQSMSEVDKSGLGGVKALQSSLNGFEDDYDRLKEDGDLGPKTTSRTKYALVNYGLKPVEERIKKSIF